MNQPTPVRYEDVLAARERIRGAVAVTPCVESIPLSEVTGTRIFCKLDNLQRTGSFKERGARNALELLDATARKNGVIAASAGNHALGLTYHARQLGIPVTVVMPVRAPLVKLSTCRRLGANVIVHGESFAEARTKADKLAAAHGFTYVHGYDDPAIIAGQGVCGLEILEQVPDVDAIVVPVGGGGLLAGVAVAVKTERPHVQIVGVEPEGAPCYLAALAAGGPIDVACQPTLADGLAVNRFGANAFATAAGRVDRVVTVAERDIALAILRILELEKSVVEGACAAGLAAMLTGRLPELARKTVVLALTGGNIDPGILSRVIDSGLVADGRLCRFAATISDRPGGLARFAARIAEAGASIKEVTHERAFAGPDVSAVAVVCTAETHDHAHIRSLMAALQDYHARPLTGPMPEM